MYTTDSAGCCPEIAYHYCSVETFYQIVTNHSLRLSDIEKSNDFMEKKWAIHQCMEHIRSNLSNPKYACTVNPTVAAFLLDELQTQFQQYNTTILAACFSSAGDLLSQWRGYGDNGYGVSIGFSVGSAFAEAYQRARQYLGFQGTEALPSSFLFHNIQYSTQQIEETCMKLFCAHAQHREQQTVKHAAYDLARLLYPALPFFKSAAFSEEKEWRCVYYPHLSAPDENESFDEERFQQQIAEQLVPQQLDQFCLLPLNYRLRQSNLVPYRDMTFPTTEIPFLRSITIGPKCALDRGTVKVFLEKNNIPMSLSDIRHSEVSYR